jgi:hypothetical protein
MAEISCEIGNVQFGFPPQLGHSRNLSEQNSMKVRKSVPSQNSRLKVDQKPRFAKKGLRNCAERFDG